jgi:type II secretory ATPase GspE/PulE/Tfp pilus assembly ATPase PilB-like protein
MVDVPLGTLIFRAGLLGEEQLEGALQEGMRSGKRLGEVLLERGWLNERDLGRMLAGQKGLPFVDVSVSDVEPEALAALAEDDARRQVALPLFYEDGELVVAVGDPSNEVVLEGLRRELQTDFQLVVAPHSQLQQVIDEAYTRPAPAPAPECEGVLFPDLVPPAKDEAPVETQPEPAFESEPEPEAQPDLGFASAVEPEFEAEPAPEIETPPPDPEAEEKPFSGSTPTLLSRMLFPSVRHAAQESGEQVADESVAEEPAPAAPEPPQASAPEPPQASAPAVEDFAEFEVPEIPEMPVPSFEQPAEATEPTPPEEVTEPAAKHVTDQPAEQVADQVAEEPADQVAEEPAEQVAEEPAEEVAEQRAEEAADQAAEQAADEPVEQAADEPVEQAAEEAQPSTHYVVVRLREGEALRIGEHGTAAEASAQAADAVAQISAAASSGTWPLFAGRYLSPDTIVSVDLLEESPDA